MVLWFVFSLKSGVYSMINVSQSVAFIVINGKHKELLTAIMAQGTGQYSKAKFYSVDDATEHPLWDEEIPTDLMFVVAPAPESHAELEVCQETVFQCKRVKKKKTVCLICLPGQGVGLDQLINRIVHDNSKDAIRCMVVPKYECISELCVSELVRRIEFTDDLDQVAKEVWASACS